MLFCLENDNSGLKIKILQSLGIQPSYTGIPRGQCQVRHVYWSHVVRCHVMCPYQSAVNRAVKMCHYMLRLRAEILTFIFLFMVFDFFKLTMFGMNRPSVPTSNLIFFFRNLSTEVICEWCPSLIGCGLKSAGQSENRELFQYLHAQ